MIRSEKSLDLAQLNEVSDKAAELYAHLFKDVRSTRLASEACELLGITKKDIVGSRLEDFAEPKVPTSVQQLRFLHTEERRLAKLKRLTEEVKRLEKPMIDRAVTSLYTDRSRSESSHNSPNKLNYSIDSSFSYAEHMQRRKDLGEASARKQIEAQERVASQSIDARKTQLNKLKAKEDRLKRQMEEMQFIQEEKKKKQDALLLRKQETMLKRHEDQIAERRRMAMALRTKMNRELKTISPHSSRSPSINRVITQDDSTDYSLLLTNIHDRLEKGAYRASVLRSTSLSEKKHKKQYELKTLENLQKAKANEEKKQAVGAMKFKVKMESRFQARKELMSSQISRLSVQNSKKRQKHDDEIKRQRLEELKREKLLKMKDERNRKLLQTMKEQHEETIRLHQEKELLKLHDARENVTKEMKIIERHKKMVLQKHSQEAEMVSKVIKEREDLTRHAKESWEEAKRLKQAAKEKMQTALQRLNEKMIV